MTPSRSNYIIGSLIDIRLAAQILGIDKKTMKRYIAKYDLRVEQGKLYSKQVQKLKKQIENCNDKGLVSLIRQLFVLEREGITASELAICDYLGKEELRQALNTLSFYSNYDRKPELERFGLNPQEFFMPGEVLARLRIKHPGVLRDIMERDSLELKIIHTPRRTRYFVPVEGFVEFMEQKGIKGKLVFLSTEVSALKRIDVNKIDKLAQRYEIGVKLITHAKNSIYLFTMEDIEHLYAFNERNNNKVH